MGNLTAAPNIRNNQNRFNQLHQLNHVLRRIFQQYCFAQLPALSFFPSLPTAALPAAALPTATLLRFSFPRLLQCFPVLRCSVVGLGNFELLKVLRRWERGLGWELSEWERVVRQWERTACVASRDSWSSYLRYCSLLLSSGLSAWVLGRCCMRQLGRVSMLMRFLPSCLGLRLKYSSRMRSYFVLLCCRFSLCWVATLLPASFRLRLNTFSTSICFSEGLLRPSRSSCCRSEGLNVASLISLQGIPGQGWQGWTGWAGSVAKRGWEGVKVLSSGSQCVDISVTAQRLMLFVWWGRSWAQPFGGSWRGRSLGLRQAWRGSLRGRRGRSYRCSQYIRY